MNEPKFKKGDWCFCEFKLQQITATKEDRITSVNDGMVSLGSWDLTDVCFPLEMKVKKISDAVAFWSDKFHDLEVSSLNHPDLNRELVSRWVGMCEVRNQENKLRKAHEALDDFGRNVLQRVGDLKNESVGNVKLFRQ